MTEIYKCYFCDNLQYESGGCRKCDGLMVWAADSNDRQRIAELEQDSERHQKAIVEGLEAVKGYINRVAELEQQLSAMTSERDAAVGRCKILERSIVMILDWCTEYKVCSDDRTCGSCRFDGKQCPCETDIATSFFIEQARKELENE